MLLILLLVTVGVCALYMAPRMHAGVHTPELIPDPARTERIVGVDLRL